ncbi:MAG: hypothetical protein J6S51_03455 [Kiritimatiellae bacterium]|nr:hypothetical protein [Kiritimatiellia bacterium]
MDENLKAEAEDFFDDIGMNSQGDYPLQEKRQTDGEARQISRKAPLKTFATYSQHLE